MFALYCSSIGHPLKPGHTTLRSDNDSAPYRCEAMTQACLDLGIIQKYSPPRKPQQNAIAERNQLSSDDPARPMLISSKLPPQFWGPAILHVQLMAQHFESSTGRPAAFTTLKVPSVLHKLHQFGSEMIIYNHDTAGKFDPRGKPAIYLTYQPNNGSHVAYNLLTGRLNETADAIINEKHQPGVTAIMAAQKQHELPNIVDNDYRLDTIAHTPVEIPHPTTTTTTTPNYNINITNDDSDNTQPKITLCGTAVTPREARTGLRADEFRKSLEEDLAGKIQNGCFEIVPHVPPGEPILRPIVTNTIKADGTAKSRITADDSSNPGEYPAPTPLLEDIKIFIVAMVSHGKHIYLADAPKAFSNGTLEKPVYMHVPSGIPKTNQSYESYPKNSDGQPPRLFIKIVGALEGMKPANQIWNNLVVQSLAATGYKPIPDAPCLHIRAPADSLATPNGVAYHVDDFLIAVDTPIEHTDTLTSMRRHFDLKDMGEIGDSPKNVLGMEVAVNRETRTVTFTQQRLIAEMLSDTGQDRMHPTLLPMKPGTQLDPQVPNDTPTTDHDQFTKPSDITEAKSLNGKILWIARGTHPCISVASNHIARRISKPNRILMNALKDVIRYLKGHATAGMVFSPNNVTPAYRNKLLVYVDSDYAGDRKDQNGCCKSTTGVLIFFNGAAVAHTCAKQQTVALHTMEAETVAFSEGARQTIPLRRIVTALGHPQHDPTETLGDNAAAIFNSVHATNSRKLRHLDIKWQYGRQAIAEKEVTLRSVPTAKNWANNLTKLEPLPRFRESFAAIMGHKSFY